MAPGRASYGYYGACVAGRGVRDGGVGPGEAWEKGHGSGGNTEAGGLGAGGAGRTSRS